QRSGALEYRRAPRGRYEEIHDRVRRSPRGSAELRARGTGRASKASPSRRRCRGRGPAPGARAFRDPGGGRATPRRGTSHGGSQGAAGRAGTPMSAPSLSALACLLALAGCVAQSPPVSPGATERLEAPASSISVPDWRPGDRWVYEWTSGSERGTRAIEVVESRTINGVDFYVLNTGDVQQY